MANNRKRQWVDTLFDNDIVNGTDLVTRLVAPEGQQDIDKGSTLIRSIIRLRFLPNVVPSTFGGQDLDVGIGIASEDALDVGGASVPDPSGSDLPISGWIFRTKSIVTYYPEVTTGPPFIIPWDLREDVHGQRKVMYGVPFVRISSITTLGASSTITMVGLIRQLWLLP